MPGRHAGEVDRPAPVRTGRRRESRRVRATRGPPAGSPAAARSSRKSPASASKWLGPLGRGSPLDPGAASKDRPLGGRAGPGGVIGGRGGPDAPTRSGRRGPGAGPAAPPLRWSMHSADQRDGRSHCVAMDKPTRSARSRPPPRRRLPGAPGPLGGGAGPAPGPVAHAPQTPPRPVRVGQGAPASTGSRGPRLIGALPGCGHGSSSLHGFRPSTTPGAIQSRSPPGEKGSL